MSLFSVDQKHRKKYVLIMPPLKFLDKATRTCNVNKLSIALSQKITKKKHLL